MLFVVIVIGATAYLRSLSISVSSMNYGRYHEVGDAQRFAFDFAIIAILLSPVVCIISVILQIAIGGRRASETAGFAAMTVSSGWPRIWYFGFSIFQFMTIWLTDPMLDQARPLLAFFS